MPFPKGKFPAKGKGKDKGKAKPNMPKRCPDCGGKINSKGVCESCGYRMKK
jgi:hypothetical protein